MTTTDPELVDVPMPNGAGVLRVPADMAEMVNFIDLPEHRPTNVIAALARVALELPGIGKDSKAAPEQGSYAYRGIEAITAEAQHLLGKYGVVFVLHEIGFSTEPLIVNNKPWTDTYLICEYDVYGPGGAEDKITVGPIHTIGRDNSDKGPNKCQPPGTMVRVPTGGKRGGHREAHSDWTEVPIEALSAGDVVVTWDRRRSALRPTGRVITGVASRPYDGPLICVEAGGLSSRYTPDHHCLVRLPDRLSDGNEVVYLMRRGSQYRIGRCRWRRSTTPDQRRSRIGLASRCAQEDADAAWVLSVHESVADAAMHEVLASVRFGIPQTSFTGATDGKRASRVSAFDLDTFWSKIGDNGRQAADCLAHFGRLMGRPLFERRPERSQIGMLPTMETAAANLLNGMVIGVAAPPVENESGWRSWPMRWASCVVSREFYSGLVHSMDVDTDHNYIADGMLTGNCRTQAFKYALLQTLCIGDAKDDADQGSPEADRPAEPMDPAQEERAKFRVERVGKLTPEQRDRFRNFADEKGLPRVTGAWSDEQLEIATEFVDKLEQETAEQAGAFPNPEALYDTPESAAKTDPTPEPDATDDAPSKPESAAEAPEGTTGPPEAPAATQGALLDAPLDVSDLPAERSSKADMRWVAKAPVAIVGECGEAVKAMSADEVTAALEAEGLPTTGNAATQGQRLAMRRIREAMESAAGVEVGSDG